MALINFFPGIAQPLLEGMSVREGKPKAAILRGLIERSSVSDDAAMRDGYELYTQIGKDVLEAYKNRKQEELFELVARALEMAPRFAPDLVFAPMEVNNAEMVKCALGSQMKFRPLEQEEKLIYLTEQSGLSKQAVLRALVMGVRLPNALALKMFGRMAQVGGLIKFISFKLAAWRVLFGKGAELQKLARQGLMREQDRRLKARGYSLAAERAVRRSSLGIGQGKRPSSPKGGTQFCEPRERGRSQAAARVSSTQGSRRARRVGLR